MEYDSGSSCEGRVKDLQNSEAPEKIDEAANNQAERETSLQPSTSLRWYVEQSSSTRPTTILPVVAKKTLSSQVMEYYHKYSQNSSLGRYFSLQESGTTCHSTSFHPRTYGSVPDSRTAVDSYVILADEERSRQDLLIPRERRRWARPPLIGQPSVTDAAATSNYVVDSRTPSPISKRPVNEPIPEERNESSRETLVEPRDNETKPSVSPTLSVASHKPLEWDSGADVGYFNALIPRSKEKDKQLCTIERMALARGCSVAMRLDPEGTNESTSSSRMGMKNSMKPDANSTPLVGHISAESESEIEITPIVKNHSSAIMKVCNEKSREVCSESAASCESKKPPKSEKIQRAPPVQIKYPTEGSRSRETRHSQLSPLKKSSSMNLLALPLSRLSLKRSQSELNLRAKEKKILPLIFDSTSSIATIVNKPITCDKFIQTSLESCSRESIGIQVEVTESESEKGNEEANGSNENIVNGKKEEEEKEEEKPPLPKRASSLVPKSLHSILKNSSNTYTVRDRNVPLSIPEASNAVEKPDDSREKDDSKGNEARVDGARTRYRTRGGGKTLECTSSSEPSRNESSSTKSEILVEEITEENATGRASNSFEYFPGHVYQNVANGSTSQVSSCDTGRESRCSTMPNTSSSIDEKLWGDSDSLVRDLERSVNILKSLVDANKCDKQVKKRLIHHVIKRLVTAKYTDDRIEHDLEENVPWNPADTRNKVYRNDIIQALVSNKQQQQQNTTDSSAEDWRPRKRSSARGNSASPKKSLSKETRALKEMIELAASSRESTNSDKFPFDGHTHRTLMDGRKARMGLRSEDQRRDTNTDGEKSQSSECFMPQLQNQHKNKSTNLFYIEKNNEKIRDSTQNLARDVPTALTTTSTATASTTSATSTSTSHRNLVSDRIVLVKERRRTETNETDWRLPTTMSERRFELRRCSNSESGDAKLINYAEMEKRNQLVWITNEISHLCNLKRLLEEPNKNETRSRIENSPSKQSAELPVSRWINQPHTEQNFSRHTDRVPAAGSEAAVENIHREEPLNVIFENQWSSHGNLASARSERKMSTKREDDRTDRVGHTRKRNSCTQTGSDGGPSGHSKTGGEIVSATLPVFASTSTTKMGKEIKPGTQDVCVQTRSISPQKMSTAVSTSSQIVTEAGPRTHSSNCPNRNKTQSHSDEKTWTRNQGHVCYCQRYAAHSRHRACIIHSPQKFTRGHSKNCPRKPRSEDRPIITQPIVRQITTPSSKNLDSRKEAKNQLNATCKSNYAIIQLPAKNKTRCGTCNQENISPVMKTGAGTIGSPAKSFEENDSSDASVFPTDCNCVDRGSDEIRRNDGSREKEDETPTSSSESAMETESRTQPDNFSSCSKCACNTEDTPWIDKRLSGGANKQDFKYSSATEANGSSEKTCKSCRTCGTIWPIKNGKNPSRKCKCSQDYLKPVAYELKFDETIREKPKNIGGKKSSKSEKIVTKDLPNNTNNNAKTQSKATQSSDIDEKLLKNCACAGEDEKSTENDRDDDVNRDELPGTLRDFLATNKPEFLENVETRRRYMSELSQLRQLKREKRKQFLAIAGSSVFSKPQRPPKGPTANVQRKLSEYEMRLRLRTRYLRLNEVRNKRRQREKEEDARRNHLMAKLFGQKLQQKVLKGQVDLSQSVSVISNL
ncbi:uncharacterized protein [Venturia canescens]|uniref:uncharacterized protein n=1 Tax=Venturia canescens TaxID=32260 RepID=UPI001C9CA297|nr:uncharacterized protein LOC122411574 [Venturia canescens]